MRVQLDGPKDLKWRIFTSHGERSQSQNLQGIRTVFREESGWSTRLKADGPGLKLTVQNDKKWTVQRTDWVFK